jgi:hypothetical protein
VTEAYCHNFYAAQPVNKRRNVIYDLGYASSRMDAAITPLYIHKSKFLELLIYGASD